VIVSIRNWNNYCLRDNANCGKIPSSLMSPNESRENCMSRTLNAAVPLTLLFSALVLSACATKPEVAPIAEPAPVEVVTEAPSAPVAVPEPPAPAPVPVAAPEPAPAPVVAEQPAPKPIVHKAKKKVVKKAAPKVAPPPAPVAAPAPVAPIALPPPPPEPSKPVAIAPQPVKKVAEPGFLEQYWLWLLGLVIVIAGIVVWQRKSQGGKS
jgi:hypothetical protein